MGSVIGDGKSRHLVDSDGDPLDDGNGRLNVNAYLSATPSIDIGDVEVTNFPASQAVTGTFFPTTQPVSNSGTFAVQLADSDSDALTTISDNSESLLSATEVIESAIKAEDSLHSSGDKGIMGLAVRRNSFLTSSADGDYTPLITSPRGALYVEKVGSSYQAFTQIVVDNASENLRDTIGTFSNLSEIILQADHDNSGYIMIGGFGTAASATVGIRIEAGDTLILDCNDSRQITMWGSASGQNLNCSILKSY